jgi:hypothetical protein
MTPWPTQLVHAPLSEIDMDSQPSRQMVGQWLAADRGKSMNCLDTQTGYSERDFVSSVALYRENISHSLTFGLTPRIVQKCMILN